MRYELMLPHQIRAAIDGRWPVVLPLGVLEYHGEHMAVGMDTLAVTRILEILESEADLVILPPFLLRRGELRRRTAGTHRHASRRRRGAHAPRQSVVQRALAHRLPKHSPRHPSSDRELRGRHADGPRLQIGRPAGDLRASSRRSVARDGGARTRWPTTMRNSRPATTLQLDQGAPTDAVVGDGRLPVRSRRSGRDLAAHGAPAGRRRHVADLGGQMVFPIRARGDRRAWDARDGTSFSRTCAKRLA